MASRKGVFTLTVVKESGIVYYGDCKVLFVPGPRDVIAIMPEHTPMIMKLEKGEVVAQDHHQKRVLTAISSGLLYVGEGEVSVIVDL